MKVVDVKLQSDGEAPLNELRVRVLPRGAERARVGLTHANQHMVHLAVQKALVVVHEHRRQRGMQQRPQLAVKHEHGRRACPLLVEREEEIDHQLQTLQADADKCIQRWVD